MKIFKTVASIACAFVVAFSSLSLFGCKPKTNKKSSNNTENVISNGGMVVKSGNFLFFINGEESQDAPNVFGKVSTSAIYRVELNEDGDKVGTPKPFVSSIVGFEFGSIYVFGDYLYYATPCGKKNSSGQVLSGLVEFWRIGVDGKLKQKLYTTKNENDEIQYAYYTSGEKDLFLVVYEPAEEKIFSIEIGSNPKKKTIASKVTSVVLSENGGKGAADNFVFFTKVPDKNDAIQTGNLVFKVKPNGKEMVQISGTGKSLSLLTIRGGMLVYSVSDIIYASNIQQNLSQTDKVISYLASSAYEDMIIFEDRIIVRDEKNDIFSLKWVGEDLEAVEICNADATFLAVTDTKLIYTVADVLFAVSIEEDATPVKLCEDTINQASGLLVAEIVGKYLYFMKTDSENLETRLFRISVELSETGTSELMASTLPL